MRQFMVIMLLLAVGCSTSSTPQAEKGQKDTPSKKNPSEPAEKGQKDTPSKKNPSEPADIKPVASLGAVQLWEEYGANGLAADAKYKGKYVELSGGVRKVQKGEGDRYFVGFAVVEPAALSVAKYNRLPLREKKWYNEGYPPNVVCYLSHDAQQAFASVKEYQNIKVIAKVVGNKRANGWRGYIVELEDTRLFK